jgi:predicted DNA-binding protein with PD1-like motif
MKYSEAVQGRTFVIRLEDGDIIHLALEKFAREKNIKAASVTVLGGVDIGSILVVGPEQGRAEKINPVETVLDEVHECTGTGTIFPDAAGNPVLHMHISAGRKDRTVTGCVRKGVKVWHVLEVIMTELTGTEARRLADRETGFELLVP